METVKGFSDYTGEEALKRAAIRKIIEETFQQYGFEPAETPIIEQEEFVRGENSDDEAVSDIFKLQDKGKRKLALRYEFTFQLKRIAKNKKLPYKRYQIGSVFRDEPVSANRVRQITQCDVDVVGAGIKEEAEVLAVAQRIFKNLGLKVDINFNNRKLLNEILDNEGIKKKGDVIREIDKLDKLSEKDVRENLKKYGAEKILGIIKKPKIFFKKYSDFLEVVELEKACKNYGVKINFCPSLARGLSYYNGSVFEIKTSGVSETISAGGSFLVGGFQATGISFGLDRLSKIAKVEPVRIKVMVISIKQDKEAVKLAESLRDSGVSCVVSLAKISKAMEIANSRGIEKVVFVGAEEVKKKKFKVKDMGSGKESFVGLKEISKVL